MVKRGLRLEDRGSRTLSYNISRTWREAKSSRLGSSARLRSTTGAKIALQRVNCGIQNHVAVRAGFEMALDLALDGGGEPTL
jgi:hypothetical protein